jgi:uncharacterized membrane protein
MFVLCNGYSSTIWTSVMFYSPVTCGGDGDNFEMNGWWRIDPGSFAVVSGSILRDENRFWYVFAEAADGIVWDGPFERQVTRGVFFGDQWCWGVGGARGDGSPLKSIGYREIDIGDSDIFVGTFVR